MNKLDKDYIQRYCAAKKGKKILTTEAISMSSTHCLFLYHFVMGIIDMYQALKDLRKKNNDLTVTRELYDSDGKLEESEKATEKAGKIEGTMNELEDRLKSIDDELQQLEKKPMSDLSVAEGKIDGKIEDSMPIRTTSPQLQLPSSSPSSSLSLSKIDTSNKAESTDGSNKTANVDASIPTPTSPKPFRLPLSSPPPSSSLEQSITLQENIAATAAPLSEPLYENQETKTGM